MREPRLPEVINIRELPDPAVSCELNNLLRVADLPEIIEPNKPIQNNLGTEVVISEPLFRMRNPGDSRIRYRTDFCDISAEMLKALQFRGRSDYCLEKPITAQQYRVMTVGKFSISLERVIVVTLKIASFSRLSKNASRFLISFLNLKLQDQRQALFFKEGIQSFDSMIEIDNTPYKVWFSVVFPADVTVRKIRADADSFCIDVNEKVVMAPLFQHVLRVVPKARYVFNPQTKKFVSVKPVGLPASTAVASPPLTYAEIRLTDLLCVRGKIKYQLTLAERLNIAVSFLTQIDELHRMAKHAVRKLSSDIVVLDDSLKVYFKDFALDKISEQARDKNLQEASQFLFSLLGGSFDIHLLLSGKVPLSSQFFNIFNLPTCAALTFEHKKILYAILMALNQPAHPEKESLLRMAVMLIKCIDQYGHKMRPLYEIVPDRGILSLRDQIIEGGELPRKYECRPLSHHRFLASQAARLMQYPFHPNKLTSAQASFLKVVCQGESRYSLTLQMENMDDMSPEKNAFFVYLFSEYLKVYPAGWLMQKTAGVVLCEPLEFTLRIVADEGEIQLNVHLFLSNSVRLRYSTSEKTPKKVCIDVLSHAQYQGHGIMEEPERVTSVIYQQQTYSVCDTTLPRRFVSSQKRRLVKAVDLYDDGAKKAFKSELEVYQRLTYLGVKPPAKVHPKRSDTTESSWRYMTMRCLGDINLFDYLTDHLKGFDAGLLLAISLKLCQAVMDLHKAGVVHRDLKQVNVVVASDGSLKIVDFAYAFLSENQHPPHRFGTLGFAAPECYDDSAVHSVATDIFTLGIVLMDLFGLIDIPVFDIRGAETKSTVDPHTERLKRYYHFAKTVTVSTEGVAKHTDDVFTMQMLTTLADTLQAMLRLKPAERCSLEAVIQCFQLLNEAYQANKQRACVPPLSLGMLLPPMAGEEAPILSPRSPGSWGA